MPHRNFGGLRGSFLGPFRAKGGFLRFFLIFSEFNLGYWKVKSSEKLKKSEKSKISDFLYFF